MDIPGFWIYLWFEICQDSEYTRVLNMPRLHRVQNTPEYFLNMPEYAWLCLDMYEYTWICQNMHEYASICLNGFCFTFPHLPICFTISFLLEQVVTYLNVYRRLEVLVWRNMRLFFEETEYVIFFGSWNYFICFLL